jgi:chemotaxis protein methyltransferase CheR
MAGEPCVEFLQWALPRLGMRWRGFRRVRSQVCKRIRRRMAELELGNFEGYRLRLESDPQEWAVLDSFCRITISRFYRDRCVFELIQERLLPEAAESVSVGPVRCWSAGCASGEEPYTLSVLWKLGLQAKYPAISLEVVATDADETMLERAHRACYPRATLRELPPEWVQTAFEPANDELCLRAEFREPVEFLQQDIRDAMPGGPFHLILCRNLVITYFDIELQARLLKDILDRLSGGGWLVIGAHEELPPGESPLERLDTGVPVYLRT